MGSEQWNDTSDNYCIFIWRSVGVSMTIWDLAQLIFSHISLWWFVAIPVIYLVVAFLGYISRDVP